MNSSLTTQFSSLIMSRTALAGTMCVLNRKKERCRWRILLSTFFPTRASSPFPALYRDLKAPVGA